MPNGSESWTMRILFVGDVVGTAGVEAVRKCLPDLIAEWKIDLTVINGENSAETGFGISLAAYDALKEAGADAVTLGNHSWSRRETIAFIEQANGLIRPINYLPGTPGRGSSLVRMRDGRQALILNALGRLFMDPIDDPFGMVDREIRGQPLGSAVDAIVVDFHCEATGEKQAMGHFCDGRVSLVVGTHTHTPSADYRILPGGTAYMTDAGMTGDYDSVVGMKKDEPIRRFTTGRSSAKFEAASGQVTICGVAVETDDNTGLALKVSPVRVGGQLDTAVPAFLKDA
jgi:2',3'-cyclic-nucleotide 2'-phosphodiesterase